MDSVPPSLESLGPDMPYLAQSPFTTSNPVTNDDYLSKIICSTDSLKGPSNSCSDEKLAALTMNGSVLKAASNQNDMEALVASSIVEIERTDLEKEGIEHPQSVSQGVLVAVVNTFKL